LFTDDATSQISDKIEKFCHCPLKITFVSLYLIQEAFSAFSILQSKSGGSEAFSAFSILQSKSGGSAYTLLSFSSFPQQGRAH
jgi:hypothetical protein